MLVPLTDIKGTTYWINPMYIKCVIPKGSGCEVKMGVQITWRGSVFKCAQPAQEIADTISAALAAINPMYSAAFITEEERARQQQTAAAAAASSG